MKTKPFSVSDYDPARDKLVCGGDPVTELLVGYLYVAGIRSNLGLRCVRRWTVNGEPADTSAGKPLEVLIPEPEKPREWWQVMVAATDTAMSPRFDTKPEAEKYLDDLGRRPSLRVAHYREVTEPAPTPERDETLSTKPDSQGWVPLHNGVPQWPMARALKETADSLCSTNGLDGPVVPCIVKPKPMTREEAIAIAKRHLKAKYGDYYQPEDWIVGAVWEAANGRAEGV